MRLGFTRREWLLVGISVSLFAAWWVDRWYYTRSWEEVYAAWQETRRELSEARLDIRIARAGYGSQPNFELQSIATQPKAPFNIQLNCSVPSTSETEQPISFLWNVKEVRLEGRPIKLERAVRTGDSWAAVCESVLDAGLYEICIDVDCAYVESSNLIYEGATKSNDLIYVAPTKLPVDKWPEPLKRRTTTLSGTVWVMGPESR